MDFKDVPSFHCSALQVLGLCRFCTSILTYSSNIDMILYRKMDETRSLYRIKLFFMI